LKLPRKQSYKSDLLIESSEGFSYFDPVLEKNLLKEEIGDILVMELVCVVMLVIYIDA
jgi:hypothetical protein